MDQIQLLEIPEENLEKLRDSYKVDWPSHINSHNLLDMMIKKLKKYSEQREYFKVLSLGGLVEEDATFIVVMV
jgi:hypothetical protein